MTKVAGSASYMGTFNKVTYISYINLKVDIFPKVWKPVFENLAFSRVF